MGESDSAMTSVILGEERLWKCEFDIFCDGEVFAGVFVESIYILKGNGKIVSNFFRQRFSAGSISQDLC